MALRGTLKDFGIADILQLIGQQQKTGTLVIKSKDQQYTVAFKDGNIVRAESTGRNRKDLIGNMLVKAGLVSDAQLDFALETQKRTLQRLGDILVAQRVLSAEKFKSAVQLQTSETLYRLFTLKTGNYEFEQKDVEVDPTVTPLRAESVLMEGFRRVDEWPVVKKRITSHFMTFEKLKEPPPPPMQRDDFDAALDDAFAEEKKTENKGEFQSVGENERRVYALIIPGRTAQSIIDLSMLGEFEACKALCNLINLEYVRGMAPAGGAATEEEVETFLSRVANAVGGVGVMVAVVAVVALVVSRVDVGAFRLQGASTFSDPAAQRYLSQQQLVRIASALEVFRLEKGEHPLNLDGLVEAGLLTPDDVVYPWREPYFYRRTPEGAYVLLPPVR